MKTFIADTPNGEQILCFVEDSGDYFDASRIIWDTSKDGDLPSNINLGGMIRSGNILIFSQDRKNMHDAAVAKRLAQEQPTKEQLLAQLQALQAQIQALE